jgi:exodeoxyribonuclease V beta subunit
MTAPRELAWRDLPLSGTSLIEASAGTGKTYNIALLYLRLLLERGLSVRQILVTTFTDAAAQELKARIRARLIDAEQALVPTRASVSDPELAAFVQACVDGAGLDITLARLRLALSEIDLAPISTIHSFCRRVLTDFPFDTGVPFTLGEMVDENALLRECVEDFWRSRFLGTSTDPWELAFALPAGLDKLVARVKPLLSMTPESVQLESTAPLRHWWTQFLTQDRARLWATVENESAFKNAEKSRLRKALRALLQAADSNDPGMVEWDALIELLDPDKVANAWKKSASTPFAQDPELQALVQRRVLFERAPLRVCQELAQAGIDFVREQIAQRLRARGQTTFSQLINEVHARLQGDRGAELAAHLAAAWPAALIDEFQDTDAHQWGIFQALYAARAEHCLILIGDPKQAIYAFRGGDIHAYLAARAGLEEQRVYSIRHNFRSHPALLQALNDLYALAGQAAFAGSGIDYVAVAAGDSARWPPSPGLKPLRLRLIEAVAGNSELRDRTMLETCADDIARLLQDADQNIAPGDIAVLLDTNRRITTLRELLLARQVPVVGAGRSSVIHTPWADDVQLLLHALLHSNDEFAVRGALATRLLGVTAAQLTALAADASAWEQQLERFAHWRLQWERRGILAVIEAIVLQQAPRLLAATDGERALTDLRHLGEVLQNAASECYGPEQLYAWLIDARHDRGVDEDASRELQLRIESESRRVQLLTVHASKGLEFPVVFVPMAWRYRQDPPGSVRPDMARYHDADHQLRLDLGSAEFAAHKAVERAEDLQERLRRLYVALTRAKFRCEIYAFEGLAANSDFAQTDRGELAVLLGAALAQASTAAIDAGEVWDALQQQIPCLDIARGRGVPARYQPPSALDEQRHARAPLPDPRPRYGLYSFTALTQHGANPGNDSPRGADDESQALALPAPAPGVPHPDLLALATLKGPRFGDAMHQMLEIGAGTLPFIQQTDRIAEGLRAQAVTLLPELIDEQLRAVAVMLDRCVQTELAPGLRLGTLAASAQRAEFEFAFALDAARWGDLARLLERHGFGDWWTVTDSGRLLRGLMKGYIDLVFAWDGRYHVLDYKTNWLGATLEDYADNSLDQAMREHRYGLQALIYTVALHRYLGRRLDDYAPHRHLGESWYLFLRAVGLAPGAGLWRRRFPQALVEGLDDLFAGAELLA